MTSSKASEISDRPGLWRLYLEATDSALETVAYSTYHDQSLIHRRLPFDPAAPSPSQALGSLVYDNEALLLADYARVSILIDTPRFMVVPDEVDSEVALAMATSLWGNDITLLSDELPLPGVRLIAAAERATAAFLRRTFPAAVPRHPMTQLITYFYNKDRMNNASKMYVCLRDNRIDIIHFNSRQLLLANTFPVANADDMVYYTMLAARQTGFDLREGDLMVCGHGTCRSEYHAAMREYAAHVMPVVFPSAMYHAGKAALDAPFELIVMPLCE